jgi:secondary thiamine-phosphate synthase enzyme
VVARIQVLDYNADEQVKGGNPYMNRELQLSTNEHLEFRDITSQVEEAVADSGVQEGVCYVFVPHTTAGLTLNENWDRNVRGDLVRALDGMVPDVPFRHSEGNSPAHLMSTVVGASATLLVQRGQIVLGTWQGIYLVEFDGPRSRQVLIKVVADPS